FVRNATAHKMVAVTPLEFAAGQLMVMHPIGVAIAIAGLLFAGITREGRRWSLPAWTFLAVLILLAAQKSSRAYYLAAAYPPVLALGGLAIERVTARTRWLRPLLLGVMVIGGLVTMPLALPILPVESLIRYQRALGVAPRAE